MSKNRKRGAKVGAQEYQVGYGKPPLETRFKPGQSGNKKGRPKKNCDFGSLFADGLEQKVSVIEQGRSRRITKRKLMVMATITAAMKGDLKAFKFIIENEKKRGSDGSPPITQEQRIALLEAELDGAPEQPGWR